MDSFKLGGRNLPFKGIVPTSGASLPEGPLLLTPPLKCPNCDETGTHPIQSCNKPCRFFMGGRCEYFQRIGFPCPFIHPQLYIYSPGTVKCPNCAQFHEPGGCQAPCLPFLMGACENERCEFKHLRPLREVKEKSPTQRPLKEAESPKDQKTPKVKIPEFSCIIYDSEEQGGGPDAAPSPHHRIVPSPKVESFPTLKCQYCLKAFKSQVEFSAHEKGKEHQFRLGVIRAVERRDSIPLTGRNCHNCGELDHYVSDCPLGFCLHFATKGSCLRGKKCSHRHIKY